MKLTAILMSISALLNTTYASAEHFNCDLALNVIKNADSSEVKQLIFDAEIGPVNKLSGVMITTSCFGTFSDSFSSETSILKTATHGDLTQGTFKDPSIAIGNYHYRLNLSFAQLTKSPTDAKTIDFATDGKLIPIDNDFFIHKIAKGECHLSKDQTFSMNFLSMPPERCKHILGF